MIHYGIVMQPAKRRSSLDASPRRVLVFMDYASKLKSELLADMILCHCARSVFLPGADPDDMSPAHPASSSHPLTSSSVLPCLRSLPK